MGRVGSDGLVNHTLQGLTQGVSEQTTEARRETQVEIMENCIPHISRGVLRRNPIKYIGALLDTLGNPLVIEDYFIYTYDRGTVGEQYLVLVGHRKWYIYNNATGTLVGSYDDSTNASTNLDYLDTNGIHPKEVFAFVTVGDHTWISNNQVTTAMTGVTDGLSITAHKGVAVYVIKSTGNVVTKSDPSTGDVTLEGYKYEVKAHYNDTDFLTTLDTATVTGNNTNKTGDIIASSLLTGLNIDHVSSTATSRTEGPFYVFSWWLTTSTTSKFVSLLAGTYSFYWDGKLVGKSNTTTLVVGIYTYNIGALKSTLFITNYYEISRVRDEITSEDPLSGFWQSVGPVVFKTDIPESAIFEYNDSFGNTASYAFKGVVPSSDKLPDTLPSELGEVLVIVDSSDDSEGGEYWLKWNGDTWVEARAPGLVNIIDHTTMPHTFLRADDGTFSFGFYGDFTGITDAGVHERFNTSRWENREKGDSSSAPEPGFIGKRINDMFIHNNRLGFLAEDAIVLSELSEYGNFFPTTVRTIPATDPIDLIVATSDVTGLKKAVSLSGVLLLFSDTAQFALTSGSSSGLSPETANIQAVSSYNYEDRAPARVIGNKVYFLTESGNGTQQFAFKLESLSGGSGNISAESTSLHIPTYLPNGVNYLQGHSILGYLFMSSPEDPNSLYVLNTLDVGGQTAQNAYHKWTFKYPIEGISVLSNALSIVFNINNELHYVALSLDLPSNHNDVSYLDDFNEAEAVSYRSRIVLSKWLVKDANGIGTVRGRLQMRTAEFTTDRLDAFKVTLVNDNLFIPPPSDENWILTSGTWDDTAYWSYNDTDTSDLNVIWKDALPFFERIYYNDNKVTVSSNSTTTFVIFDNNDLTPDKGFALSTVNYEGMFRQRSARF